MTAAERAEDHLFWCQDCQRSFASPRGLASHRGRVHNDRPSRTCEVCGAVIGDRALHERYHQNQQAIAVAARHADMMTRPIGSVRQ